MKQRILKLLVISLLYLGALNMAISQEVTKVQPSSTVILLKEQQRLTVHIAKDTMSRLAIVNDRIASVIGEEEAFTMQHDEHTGQVFIKPAVDNSAKPIAVTLITENGVTQDLTLIPSKEQAATIILKPATYKSADPANFLLPGFKHSNQNKEELLIQVMKQAVLGKLPPLNLTNKTVRGNINNLKLKFDAAYQAGELLVEVWLVKNISQHFRELQEKEFFKVGDLAISAKELLLLPRETSKLYIVRES